MTFLWSILCYLLLRNAVDSYADFVLLSRNKRTSVLPDSGVGDASQPSIYEMTIFCDVTNRFATTTVTAKVKNSYAVAKEKVFSVLLPNAAYISGFDMELDGKTYKAFVMERQQAQQVYTRARESGQAAAHVQASARDSNRFTISTNIEPQSTATFHLIYEEMLVRENCMYEIILNIHPGQVVKDFEVVVSISESSPIKFVQTPALRSGKEIVPNEGQLAAEKSLLNDTSAIVYFKPGAEEQQQLGMDLDPSCHCGIAGQFVVQYDIDRTKEGGELMVDDENFIHFFSIENAKTLPTHVVFVLDTSGSMDGDKIRQLRDAMFTILDQVNQDSLLSVVDFSSCRKVWNIERGVTSELCGNSFANLPKPVRATESAISSAKRLVWSLTASDLTGMHFALKTALELTRRAKTDEHNKYQPLIVLLTDGEPTDTAKSDIIEDITEKNAAIGAAITTLSFGDSADKSFLETLATKNKGTYKHIEASRDASLQLDYFYKTIADLLLADIHFSYSGGASEVTKNDFDLFFGGKEIIVAGKLGGDKSNFQSTVTYKSSRGSNTVRPQKKVSPSSLERGWAYLLIKDLLQKRKTGSNEEVLTQQALRKALKYSFVTEVTSLVAVKPSGNVTCELEKVKPELHGYQPTVSMHSVPSYQPDYFYIPPKFSGRDSVESVQTHSIAASYPAFATSFHHFNFGGSSGSIGTSTPRIDDSKKKTEDVHPWIRQYLRTDRKIRISKGKYGIGTYDLGENIDDDDLQIQPCENSVHGNGGRCRLLRNCKSTVTSFDNYLKYFCSFEHKYAGICC